jgi:hypothetical protein
MTRFVRWQLNLESEENMKRGRRPDIFDKEAMLEGVVAAGCPKAYADAYLGDFKLFVPLLLRELGEQEVLRTVNTARLELGLKEEDTYWKDGAKYFVQWATNAIDAYKASKGLD